MRENDRGNERAAPEPPSFPEKQDDADAAQRQHAEDGAIEHIGRRRRVEQGHQQKGKGEDQGLRIGDLR